MTTQKIARELIRVARKLTAYEHGFDLTEIRASKWIQALKSVGVSTRPRKTSKGWVWKGPGILVVTANDPISGEYYNGKRSPEPDYASYIGIEGDEEKVMKLVEAIKGKADYIKNEEPGQRGYI